MPEEHAVHEVLKPSAQIGDTIRHWDDHRRASLAARLIEHLLHESSIIQSQDDSVAGA